MPNPYNGNEEAAWFVDYYASPRMTSETVHRLYTCGVQHHQLVQRRAEEKAYPPVPTALRTRAEMERYLRERVQGELLRRQQHRAALRRQYSQQQQQQQQRHYTASSGGDGGAAVVDGDKATPRRCLTEKELQRHLRKLYVEPMRRRAQRQQQQQQQYMQHAGSDGADELNHQRRRLLHELEMGWRPPSAHIAHKDDGARLLVWQDTSPSRTTAATTPADAAATARTPASRCVSVPARSMSSSSSPAAATHKQHDTNRRSNTPPPTTTTQQQQQKKQTAHRGNRLAELAKPLRVTPRIIAAPRDPDAPPSFRVSLK